MTSQTLQPTQRAGASVVTLAGLALAGGAIEATILYVRCRQNPMMALSDDFALSVPLALAVAALLAAAPFLLLSGVWPRLSQVAVFAGLAVVMLDLVFLIPRLSQIAAALLAAGLAVQLAKLVRANPDRWRRLAGRSAAVAALLCVVLWWVPARGAIGTTAASAPSTDKPNVLVVTLDTVRAASLSLYGYQRPTSPSLARIGAQGAVFDHAFATAPWTLPSHASLFTGRLPFELGVDYYTPLAGSGPRTLAEHFAGHRSAGFVANLGYAGRGTGLARGFEAYEDYPRTLGQLISNSTLLRKIADNFTLRRWLRNDEHLNRVTADDLNARFFNWLDQDRDTSFFAFLNYFDAHEPYLPPPLFERRFGAGRQDGRHSPLHHAQWNPAWPSRELTPEQLREEQDAYDEAIAYLDDRIGALVDGLAQRGVLDRTLLVITSDHGEEFAEHRVLEHGYSMYRAGLHVPLIMRFPAKVPTLRIGAPVSLADVAATIVDIVDGGRLDAASGLPGRSLAAHWNDPGATAAPVVSTLSRPPGYLPDWYPIAKGDMHSVVWGGYHWILNGDGTEELYDLAADADERENLSGRPEHAKLRQEMRAHLEAARRMSQR